MQSVVDRSIITDAVEHLRQGELVVFPTETVYGLGADASNEKALEKLYAIKGRPANHPVIVHLASFEQMIDWGTEITEYARLLASRFWPGPLTLIVKKLPHVLPMISGGQDTIALRVPGHPAALALLEAFGNGVAAPSANRYGRISSTSVQHVRHEFGNQISVIIDGGNCAVGIESTIIDTTGPMPIILRPGVITEEEIFRSLGFNKMMSMLDGAGDSNAPAQIRVPGSDRNHYAPETPLLLLDKNAIKALLSRVDIQTSLAILALSKFDLAVNPPARAIVRKYIQAPGDPSSYGHDLYANLHLLDKSGAETILVEVVPGFDQWLAIADRLKRAATKQ